MVRDQEYCSGTISQLSSLDVPGTQQNEAINQIQQILDIGAVKYVHENESLLKPSKMEEETFKEFKVMYTPSRVLYIP